MDIKMKLTIFLSFVTVLSQVSSQDSIGCEVCRSATNLVWEWMLSPEILYSQQVYLSDKICPTLPDVDGCRMGVLTWWERISNILFNHDASARICHQIDSSCTASARYVIEIAFRFL